ncbi:rho GTPase-activating protein 25 [Denticeps clupeoides]|uniref:Rho GTPase-activating protein 24 n=1 Tax=Denticeps clupeoides TaxID=299321 RepID=A0AAY4B4Q7_9TELE|nr:rho GTPase-activating protein 25-like [Denticeps clupeoides]
MSLKLPRNWDFSLKTDAARIARSRSIMPGEGSPGSCPKRSLEKPLKMGWLKKQRSIVKNWQLRYFVLRGSILTYYKDDRETSSQGQIQLWSCQVNDLPTTAEDKFLFEIIPPSVGDREREPYVLMARTQTEMEEWVRSIRRVIGAPSSGVFGKALGDIMAYEKRSGSHTVPILVEKCSEFIRVHGLSEEGIFRLPGQDNQVKQFRDAFDAGERPSFPSDTDVHTVASLLKLYLRELPEPVVPWSQYQDFLDCSNQLDANTAAGRENLVKQIALLPTVNYNLLSYVCRFLYEVGQNAKVNKMSVENLATVIGVNLFKPQMEDAITLMKGTPQIQKVMTVMIRHHELLFPFSNDAPKSPTVKKTKGKKLRTNFVGWEAAECENSSLSESPEEEDAGTPETETRDGWPSDDSPSSPPTELWRESPRKRTQTLPSLISPGSGKLTREDAPYRWSRITEICEEKEEKTLSEDIFKILDLQRVSLFSQKQTEGPQTRMDDECTKRTNSRSATKPREAPTSPDTAAMARSPPSLVQKAENCPVREEPVKVTPVAASQPKQGGLGDSVGNGGSVILSLQQRNQQLTALVAELRSALDAEKQRVAALEIRLRQVERSRDEALKQNQELDKEIQHFLSKAPSGPP